MIPGTRLIVSGLLQNELCRALVVAATNNERMMPIPQPITTGRPGEAGAVTWAYNLAPGNATGAPFCGTVTVRSPAGTSSTTLMGVSMDMTGTQRQILENVVQQHIRPVARQVADNLWRTRQAAALAPMMDAYVSATDSYTRQLTEAATNVTLQLRAAVKADDLRRGTYRSQNQVDRLWAINWSGAGAYSMKFARLNGATLSRAGQHPDCDTTELREPGNQHSPRPRPSRSRRYAMEGNDQNRRADHGWHRHTRGLCGLVQRRLS